MSALDEAIGLFGPGSASWRIDRELIVLAGGSCALLMQAAHPVVAAGVTEHSSYASDPFGRLTRTLESSFDVVFGSRSTAEAAIRRVNAIHAAVRGEMPDGRPYSRHRSRCAALGPRHAGRHRAPRLRSIRRAAQRRRRAGVPRGGGRGRLLLGVPADAAAADDRRPAGVDGTEWSDGTGQGHARRARHRAHDAASVPGGSRRLAGRWRTSSRWPRCPPRCAASTASAGRRRASAAWNAWRPSAGARCRSCRPSLRMPRRLAPPSGACVRRPPAPSVAAPGPDPLESEPLEVARPTRRPRLADAPMGRAEPARVAARSSISARWMPARGARAVPMPARSQPT